MLPGWAIIDGQFYVSQERRSIHVAGEAARPLREAFAALGGLMLVATREHWIDGFRIAQLAIPAEVTGEAATTVWYEILSSAARTLSRLPLVSTSRVGSIPSVEVTDVEWFADFIRLPSAGPSHDELWELAVACIEADPPVRAVSEGWSEIAEGWEKLGVKISWIDLQVIGERASSGVTEISKLRVECERYDWLSRYSNAVGKTWKGTE